MGAPIASGVGRAFLVAAMLASPLQQVRAQSTVPPAAPVLREVAGLEGLRAQFEIDGDKIRIVLLLSPT